MNGVSKERLADMEKSRGLFQCDDVFCHHLMPPALLWVNVITSVIKLEPPEIECIRGEEPVRFYAVGHETSCFSRQKSKNADRSFSLCEE